MEEAFNSSRFEIVSTSTEDDKPEFLTSFDISKVVTRESFTKICRTCMVESDIMIPILDSSLEDDAKLIDLLSLYTSVQVYADDTLPLNICNNCLGEIVRTYKFKKRCREVQATLKLIELKGPIDTEFVSSNKTNNKIVELKQEEKLGYICALCNKSFIRKHNLKIHLKGHGKEKPCFKCETCPMIFSYHSRYLRHKMTHTGERPFVCKICNKGFTQFATLQKHLKIHANDEERYETYSLTCKVCGAAFKTTKNYKLHLQKHENNEEETINKNKSPNTTYPCNMCERTYKSITSLKAHMDVHKGKKYLCKNCGKSFNSSAGLISHSVTHTGERPHKCIHCSKAFSTINVLNNHILTHSNDRPYVCNVCSKTFKQAGHLGYHKLIHSDERPYSCPFCEKTFKMKTNLTVHTRMHTGETPHVCPECGKGFYDSSSMKRHWANHLLKNKIKDEPKTISNPN